MFATDTLDRLDGAQAHLDRAIRSLLDLNSVAGECPASLQNTAGLLSSIDVAAGGTAPRVPVELLLKSIAVKVATARRLLDSAAALYFGAVLHCGSLEQGYSQDGVAAKFGGGCLRVEG